MAGVVYLRTNRFEVKLEGITFKAKEFESLCSMDFLFPEGKIWARPPIVGIDVMSHPRDPSIVLLLFCFGVGCMILRFHLGETIPEAIFKFLTDERIRFVAFGIPEKKGLFPFQELGLHRHRVDIGYLAAKILNDSKYKRWELAELARKVLGIKNMIGLTDASSFERHEQIKCAICQLFITSAIGMALLNKNEKKSEDNSPKKGSFLKSFNSLPLFTEGWFKFRKGEKETDKTSADNGPETLAQAWIRAMTHDEHGPYATNKSHAKVDSLEDDHVVGNGDWGTSADAFNIMTNNSTQNPSKEDSSPKKPLKGILKCPSSYFDGSNPSNDSTDSSSPEFQNAGRSLKRANSKGFNVSFKH